MSTLHVSQIYITDPGCGELPPYLSFASGTVKQCFADARHSIYDGDALREHIACHYGSEVVWAYDRLVPYAYKADLGRYCLLNSFGGWYFDISVRCAFGASISDQVRFLAFRDRQRVTETTWACQTAVLYSKPNNTALQIAIDKVVGNCRDMYYGINPLCPTGPVLLGEALAAHRSQADFLYGDFMELTPEHQNTNPAFVLPDGGILAWGKPAAGGDLAALGATGVHNYNEFWRNRMVYRTSS